MHNIARTIHLSLILVRQTSTNAMITIRIIIAGIINGRRNLKNQYRIPFAAVVKTRERGWVERIEGGRDGEGGRMGRRRGGGGVVMCE